MNTIIRIIIICLLIIVIASICSESISDNVRAISCIMLFLAAILDGYIEEQKSN